MWGDVIDRSRALVAETRAIRANAGRARARARNLRRTHAICGSSDVDGPLLASLITDASLCGDCIARKAGIPRWRVDDAMSRVGRVIQTIAAISRCDACLKETVVHRLGRRPA
jgi:hypothetical protein